MSRRKKKSENGGGDILCLCHAPDTWSNDMPAVRLLRIFVCSALGGVSVVIYFYEGTAWDRLVRGERVADCKIT